MFDPEAPLDLDELRVRLRAMDDRIFTNRCCMLGKLGSDPFPIPFFAAGQQQSDEATLEVQRNKLGDRAGQASHVVRYIGGCDHT
jgi:hypothetical protein